MKHTLAAARLLTAIIRRGSDVVTVPNVSGLILDSEAATDEDLNTAVTEVLAALVSIDNKGIILVS